MLMTTLLHNKSIVMSDGFVLHQYLSTKWIFKILIEYFLKFKQLSWSTYQQIVKFILIHLLILYWN